MFARHVALPLTVSVWHRWIQTGLGLHIGPTAEYSNPVDDPLRNGTLCSADAALNAALNTLSPSTRE